MLVTWGTLATWDNMASIRDTTAGSVTLDRPDVPNTI